MSVVYTVEGEQQLVMPNINKFFKGASKNVLLLQGSSENVKIKSKYSTYIYINTNTKIKINTEFLKI